LFEITLVIYNKLSNDLITTK